MNNTAKKTLFVLATMALLASCGKDNQPVSSASDSGWQSSSSISSGSQTSSKPASSSEEEEEYVIQVSVSSGVKLSLSHTRAKAGETVTITVTEVTAGFVLNHIYMNGTELFAQGDAGKTYSFTMPKKSVYITADVSVDGDVVIAGDISAKFVEETPGSGLYVARNVKVENESSFSFYAFGDELSSTDLDYTKCLADVQLGSGSGNNELTIAGGCTYDFYFDSTGEHTQSKQDPGPGRCYIRRVSVDTLPTDPSSLHSLFDGYTRSSTTENILGAKKLTFKNRVADVDYEWNNYEDGSLATAKSITSDKSKGVVYKQLNDAGTVYTKIDTYIEGDENSSTHHFTNTKAYAKRVAVYGKWGDIPANYESYSTYLDLAQKEAHEANHTIQGIRFDIQNAYYVGWDAEFTDGLALNERKVTSSRTENGFNVKVASYREISATAATTATDVETAYYKYTVDLNFDTVGQPVSGTYLAEKYGTDSYNFSTHKITNPEGGKTIGDIEFEYTYGEATGKVEFDTSKYLTTELSAKVLDEHVDGMLNNTIAVTGDDGSSTINAHLTVGSNLADDDGAFLDKDNYTIIDIENKDLVKNRTANSPFTYLPIAEGTTKVTIGIPGVPSAPTYTFDLKIVDNIKVRGFYMTEEGGVWAGTNYLTTSTSFALNAGTVRRFRVYGSSGDYTNVPFTPVSSNEDLLTCERYVVNNQAYIKFDASKANVDKTTKVTVTLESTRYIDGWGPTKFDVTIYPGSSFSYLGDYYKITSFDTSKEPYVAKTVDKTVTASIKDYVEDDENTVSCITVSGTDYKFGFIYDGETGTYDIKKVTNNISQLYLSETVDGYLGIILVDNSSSWTGLDEGTENKNILGDIEYDDEGELLSYSFDSFAPAKDW